MGDQESLVAISLLQRVDASIIPTVKQNQQLVQEFLNHLQQELNRSTGLLRQSLFSGAHYMHGGSAYEGLSVKTKTDFDIQIILNEPYTANNFEVFRDSTQNVFALQWNIPGRQRFFDAVKLQEQLFNELVDHVKRLKMGGVRVVSYKTGLAALNVTIVSPSRPSHLIEIDLAPQIASRKWSGFPDLVPLHQLPTHLRSYIRKLHDNSSPIFTFTPGVPGRQAGQQQLVNISFAMLEKEFLKSNPLIREMVRLVKLIGEAQQWKKEYGLKSYFIKRVAIKYCDDIKHKSVWKGYQALLAHIYEELQRSGTIDGFFVKDQNTYKKPPHKLQELKQAIAQAYKLSLSQFQAIVQEKLHL